MGEMGRGETERKSRWAGKMPVNHRAETKLRNIEPLFKLKAIKVLKSVQQANCQKRKGEDAQIE